MTLGEPYSLCGKIIEHRGFIAQRPVAAKCFITQVIGQYQNDIWLFASGLSLQNVVPGITALNPSIVNKDSSLFILNTV